MHNKHQARTAVATYFFTNGFLHANLNARLPEIQQQWGVSEAVLGSLLFAVALGALVGMPITGGLAARYGSHRMAYWTGLAFCVMMPLVAFTYWVAAAAVALFFMGLFMGAMDVCMNGQAVFVERSWKKPIMSSFHAIFSVGMALGAGSGAVFSKMQVHLGVHIAIMAVVSMAALLWGRASLVVEQRAVPDGDQSKMQWPTKAILPLGIIALCCMTGEGAMADWSALYMNKVVGQSAAFSAVAFGTYAVGMTLGRFLGDYNKARFGARNLVLANAFLASIGLAVALLWPSVVTVLLGFFTVGLGVSTVVPIVFSAAGNTPGVNPSMGIAMATTIGYTGFFVGPPVIGFLSDACGMRVGLGFALGLFVLMGMLAYGKVRL